MSLPIIDRTARVQYTATAGQTQFTVPFEFFAGTDLKVYVGSVLQSTGYTVSGAGIEGGGYITFSSGRTAGEIVTVQRDIPIDRTSDFPVSGPFPIEALNDQLARLTAQIQQLETSFGLCLQLSAFDVAGSVTLPTLDNRKGKLLRFDETTGNVTTYGLDEILLPATGPTGPAAWGTPAAWASGVVYSGNAPRSVVIQSGETYVCLVSHTSSAFATDLAANYWIKVAAKGADGSGTATWGGISGTLSNQTDLQAALSGKAATGANADITSLTGLGNGSLTAVSIRLGSANTGFYRPVTNAVGIVTNGTERLRFLAAGGITSEDVANAVGYKGIVANAKTAAYTLAASDMGQSIDITTGGVTIPDGLPSGFACQVFNNSASAQTVTKSGTETMRRVAGTTATNLTLAAYGKALIEKRDTIILIDGNLS
jgi:hypothetical protein